MVLLRAFTIEVGHVSSSLVADGTLLVVVVELVNIETSTTLVVTKDGVGTRL